MNVVFSLLVLLLIHQVAGLRIELSTCGLLLISEHRQLIMLPHEASRSLNARVRHEDKSSSGRCSLKLLKLLLLLLHLHLILEGLSIGESTLKGLRIASLSVKLLVGVLAAELCLSTLSHELLRIKLPCCHHHGCLLVLEHLVLIRNDRVRSVRPALYDNGLVLGWGPSEERLARTVHIVILILFGGLIALGTMRLLGHHLVDITRSPCSPLIIELCELGRIDLELVVMESHHLVLHHLLKLMLLILVELISMALREMHSGPLCVLIRLLLSRGEYVHSRMVLIVIDQATAWSR